MNIKIDDNRSVVRFMDIGNGDGFGFDGHAFIKIRDVTHKGQPYNCIMLEDMEIDYVMETEEVEPFNEMVITIS